MDKKQAVSGLDTFSQKYLFGSDATDGKEILVADGDAQKSEKVKEIYLQRAKEEFIQRAGSFTEDLIGFIVDQKKRRNLDDKTVVFGLALANINLRNSFCSPQNGEEEKEFNGKRKQTLETEWDEICWAAQCYFDENT